MSDRDLRGAEFPLLSFRDGVGSLHATLEYDVLLGGGYVAMRDGLGEACYVIRLSDGHMARFDPPGYTCSSVRHVGERELAVVVAHEGDLSFRSAQLWFVPLAALTFEP